MPELNKPNVNLNKSTINDFADYLFGDPGKKIKLVAVIAFVLSVLGVLIYFFNVVSYNGELAFVILIVGLLASYVGSLFLVGFGELIENSRAIAGKASKQVSPVEPDSDELPEL